MSSSTSTDSFRNDHYVPQTYLRHFTEEYINGKSKPASIPVYRRTGGRCGPQPVDIVCGEKGFYDNHEIDTIWTKAEKDWPDTVKKIEENDTSEGAISKLLNFLAFQYVRTPTYIEPLARRLRNRQLHKVEWEGKMVNAMTVDVAIPKEIFDVILTEVESVRKSLRADYNWTIYESRPGEFFFTSDTPVRLVPDTQEIVFPITCKRLARGKLRLAAQSFNFHYATASQSKMQRLNKYSLESANGHVFYPFDTPEVADIVKAGTRPISYDPIDGGRSWGAQSVQHSLKTLKGCWISYPRIALNGIKHPNQLRAVTSKPRPSFRSLLHSEEKSRQSYNDDACYDQQRPRRGVQQFAREAGARNNPVDATGTSHDDQPNSGEDNDNTGQHAHQELHELHLHQAVHLLVSQRPCLYVNNMSQQVAPSQQPNYCVP